MLFIAMQTGFVGKVGRDSLRSLIRFRRSVVVDDTHNNEVVGIQVQVLLAFSPSIYSGSVGSCSY